MIDRLNSIKFKTCFLVEDGYKYKAEIVGEIRYICVKCSFSVA